MDSIDALKLMTRQFPGGLPVVALRIGKNEETLRKELSGDAKFKLGHRDCMAISDLCIEAQSPDCYAFVNAIAGGAGQMIALPVRDMADESCIRTDMAGMLKECSDVFGAITEALSDGGICDNDMKRITREVGEMFGKAQSVLQQARAKNLAGKPVHLRSAA